MSTQQQATLYRLTDGPKVAPVARENPKDPGNDRELLLNKWIKRWIIRVLIPLVVFSLAMDILLSAFFE